jgi:choline monooxygenase
MTDLSGVSQSLLPAATQLPLSVYFDPSFHALEQATLFAHTSRYVGHRLMVPNINDFQTLPAFEDGWMLTHSAGGIEMVSNICRHRQAMMLKGRGSTPGAIVCPLHRWTYDLKGELLGAPHFADQPCLSLPRKPLQDWRGMLFTGPRDVAQDLERMGVARDLDFSEYVFDRVEVTDYPFNWKTFIEVYLEDYHVEPFHPGLGNFVDCGNLKWEFGDAYSVQTVGVKNSLLKAGTPTYDRWQSVVRQFRGGQDPDYGAIWLTYYPNVMIEWYPHVLVISTVVPTGPEQTRNVVEFYYPEEIYHFEREFIEAEQQAYSETAAEDEEICVRMTEGRKRLWREGREEHGPYQSPMEDGMQHFHEWVRRNMPVG